jgi:Flp pilus assembly protein TadD
MSRRHFRWPAVLAAAVIGAPAWMPAPALAQEDCIGGGNQHTRGAELELSWASRRDDPQSKQDRYARALEKLEPAFAPPVDPRAYLLSARAHLGLRHYASADSMLAKLVEAVPGCQDQAAEMRFNAWVPLYNQGIDQLKGGDEGAALQAFETANLIFEDARSLNNAASIYQRQGDDGRAMELYRRALTAGGDDDMRRVASINLAELLRAAGQAEDALAIYSDYASAHPEDILGRLNYAIALMDAGDGEAAERIFLELMGRDDLSFLQWSQVGIGLYRAGEFRQASDAFRKAHDLQPQNKETLENLANSYYQSDEYAALAPLADTLVQRYPYERVNYNLLANARTETGDEAGALAVLERREALKFEFLRAQMGQTGDNVYSLEGQVMNTAAEGGLTVTIPVHFVGEAGEVVITEPLELTLPGQGEPAAFQLQVQSETPIAGFRYEKATGAGGS